jgi:outer membrane beta-barrel protein
VRVTRPGVNAPRVIGFFIVVGLILLLQSAAEAQEDAAAGQKPSDTPVPSCLDQSIKDELGATLKPRGVQKRPFTKDGELNLTARGGLFASDLLSTNYTYGGALALFFTEDLALELSFDVTPVSLELDEPLADFFGDDRFEGGTGYLPMAGLVWSPVHAKLKMGGGIVHSDIMFVAGGGRMFGHDAIQGIAFNGGMILEFYLTNWVTFRLDIRDVVMIQEAVSETRLTNNIMATGGIGLWIPVGL